MWINRMLLYSLIIRPGNEKNKSLRKSLIRRKPKHMFLIGGQTRGKRNCRCMYPSAEGEKVSRHCKQTQRRVHTSFPIGTVKERVALEELVFRHVVANEWYWANHLGTVVVDAQVAWTSEGLRRTDSNNKDEIYVVWNVKIYCCLSNFANHRFLLFAIHSSVIRHVLRWCHTVQFWTPNRVLFACNCSKGQRKDVRSFRSLPGTARQANFNWSNLLSDHAWQIRDRLIPKSTGINFSSFVCSDRRTKAQFVTRSFVGSNGSW